MINGGNILFYRPLEDYINKTWVMNDFEQIK
jgi:hypothetical protein